MSGPITWQNIGGASLSEASRPLEVAQRSFGNMFDGLMGVIKNHEDIDTKNWEAGRKNNTDAFLDRLATYNKPEDLKAAIESGDLAKFKQSFGDQIDHGAVRTAAEGRLTSLMSNAKQAGEFQNWQTDFNQAPLVDEIKAQIASNDPKIRAIGIQRAQEAQIRQRAALVAAGTEADRSGLRFDEDKKQWVRNQGEYDDKLKTNAVTRQVALGNLAVNQGQLDVSRGQLGVSQDNQKLNRDRFGLELIKAREGSEDRLMAQQGDIVGRLGKVGATSIRSAEGAKEVADAMAKLPEKMQAMGRELYQKMHDANIPTGDAVAAMNGLQQTWLGSDSGDVERAFQSAVKNGVAGNLQQKTATFQADQYLRQLEENKQRVKTLDQTYGQISAGRGPSENSAVPPALRNKGMASGGFNIEDATRDSETGEGAGPARTTPNPVSAPPAPPVDPVAAAEQTLRAAQSAFKTSGKGYYSEEAQALRTAEENYADVKETRDDLLKNGTGKVKQLERQVAALQPTADKFVEQGKPIPTNVKVLLERAKADLEVLKGRQGKS